MTQNFKFSAFESEIIKPFETFDDIFNDCKVMVSEEEGFIEDSSIFIDNESDSLKLQLKFDINKLPIELKNLTSELAVNVFFQDLNGAKDFKKIHHQSLSEIDFLELDLEPLVPVNYNVANSQILLTLVKDEPSPTFERLALKRFKFVDYNQSLDFPKVSRSANEFEQAGFYRLAPFALKWVGEDLDKPINELVELWLNKEHELSMWKLNSSKQEFSKSLIAVHALQEILYKIIKQALHSSNYKATAAVSVFAVLKTISIEQNDVISLQGRPDFKSIVNSWAMQLTKLHESLNNDYF